MSRLLHDAKISIIQKQQLYFGFYRGKAVVLLYKMHLEY